MLALKARYRLFRNESGLLWKMVPMISVDHLGLVSTRSMAFELGQTQNKASTRELGRMFSSSCNLALASDPGTFRKITGVGFGDMTTMCLWI